MKPLPLLSLVLLFVGSYVSIGQSNSGDPIDNPVYSIEDEKEYILKYDPVVIKKLTVDIEIDTNGFFTVEEHYSVLFNKERRGILRFIYLKYLLDIKDENQANTDKSISTYLTDFFFPVESTRRIFIEDIEVENHPFKLSGLTRFSDKLEIKIGDEDVYLTGDQEYIIRYKVKNAFLFRDSVVDFYWNFLGGNWDIPFLDVQFNIKLQGNVQLDSTDFKLYGGPIGTTNSLSTLKCDSNSVSGFSPLILKENEDLTVMLHLPFGYVKAPSEDEIFWSRYAWPIYPAGVIILFFVVWLLIGKEKRLINQVQYYPPKDIDPALAGFLIDSKSDNRDIVSLIPYWASMGILTIEEVKNAHNDKFAKLYLKFKQVSNYIYIIFLVTLLTLLYNENFTGFIFLFLFFTMVSIMLFLIQKSFRKKSKADILFVKKKEFHDYAKNYEKTVFNGIFKGDNKKVDLSSLEKTFYSTLVDAKSELEQKGKSHGFTKNSSKQVNITILVLIIFLLVGGFFLIGFYSPVAGITHILVCILLLSISKSMDKRSPQGDETLKDVIGFRTFIKKAEKSKIDFLLKEDPLYFDKTIAYAVAFGMSDSWGKKFDGVVVKPKWYSSDSDENFNSSFNRMVFTATVSMSVSPSSGSSGGSSSSGSSGGGFGGGGGSSW
jgi:uncharacterized membrane protein YgcG